MSIHHMATDYYGTPSYGYDAFVTISSKRNVAVQVLDSTKWMPAVLHNLWPIMLIAHFGLRASRESGMERYPKRTGPFGPLAALAGPLSGNCHLSVVCSATRSRGDNSMALSNDAQIAMEQGMMIAEVNIAIGAIDRILKTTKHGRSHNRELTNARAELDHWRARLLKTVHKC